MSISIHIKKIGIGMVVILAGEKIIGRIRGQIFPTKIRKRFIERKFDDRLGMDRDIEVDRIVDGPSIDTLVEKSKCVVEWMNIVYTSKRFGILYNIK